MVAVSDKESQIVLCGQGRIGARVGFLLAEKGIPYQIARIDPIEGICGTYKHIKVLLICISAGQKRKQAARWLWKDIFSGLCRQVTSKTLTVEQIILVSSTRVYEAIESGFVTASTLPNADSEAGKGIIYAEQQLMALPVHLAILRCSGLFGELYPKYTPILMSAKDKPRFGINAEAVIARLVTVVQQAGINQFSSQVELITDGNVYYQSCCYEAQTEELFVAKLAKHHRILLNSINIFD